MEKQTTANIVNGSTTTFETHTGSNMANSAFDYYIYIKPRLKWLIIVPIICGILGILYSTFQNHKYVAALSFVANNDNGSNPYSVLMQQVGIDMNSSDNAFEGDNLIEFLKTRSLIEQTLLTPVTIKNKQQLLVDYYLDVYQLKEKWDKPGYVLNGVRFYQDRSGFSMLQDSALKLIYDEIVPVLSVGKPDKRLSVVNISLTGKDQYWAKAFVETLVANATKTYITSKTSKLQDNVNILQIKVDSINRRLSGSLSNIATTEDININPTKRAAQVPVQRQQINVQVNNALLVELIKNLELAKIQLSKGTPFIQVLDRPILPLEDKKPGKLLSGIIGGIIGGILTIVFFVGQIQFIKLKRYLIAEQQVTSKS
jgi:hypothetical protein